MTKLKLRTMLTLSVETRTVYFVTQPTGRFKYQGKEQYVLMR